jgi:hypothetical protein
MNICIVCIVTSGILLWCYWRASAAGNTDNLKALEVWQLVLTLVGWSGPWHCDPLVTASSLVLKRAEHRLLLVLSCPIVCNNRLQMVTNGYNSYGPFRCRFPISFGPLSPLSRFLLVHCWVAFLGDQTWLCGFQLSLAHIVMFTSWTKRPLTDQNLTKSISKL